MTIDKRAAARRSTIGKLGAASLHAQGKTNTGPATKAFMARFEKQVDPDGILHPEERAKRAAHAKSCYYLQLSRKSVLARRKKAIQKIEKIIKRYSPDSWKYRHLEKKRQEILAKLSIKEKKEITVAVISDKRQKGYRC
tara:strand:+ start:12 stop:428 length:417 start_codon:yes stop_codon:yes gene_type:complete